MTSRLETGKSLPFFYSVRTHAVHAMLWIRIWIDPDPHGFRLDFGRLDPNHVEVVKNDSQNNEEKYCFEVLDVLFDGWRLLL